MPEPGAKPPTHPFVGATSFDPGEEDPISRLLDRARDFEDFVRLLKSAGYTLLPSR